MQNQVGERDGGGEMRWNGAVRRRETSGSGLQDGN